MRGYISRGKSGTVKAYLHQQMLECMDREMGMKKRRIFLLVLLIILLAACKTTTDEPKQIEIQSAAPEIIETDLPVETPVPAAQVISISNASYIHSTARLTYPIPYRVMWSPDSSRFAVGSNDGFRVFDAVSLECIERHPGSRLYPAGFLIGSQPVCSNQRMENHRSA